MIYLLRVLATLGACFSVFYVSNHVITEFLPELLKLHKTALESAVEKLDAMAASITKMAAINVESARGTAAAHRDGLRDTLKAHADALTTVTASHGTAAEHLSAASAAHHAAAGGSADSTVEMRQAAEQLKTLCLPTRICSRSSSTSRPFATLCCRGNTTL